MRGSKIMLLSICIPHFNQVDALEITLKNLEFVELYLGNVEILISDNGSSAPEAELVIEKFASKIINARAYYGKTFSETNSSWFSGLDSNLFRLKSEANGKYLWFLGAGEVINRNTFDFVLQQLKLKKFDNLVLGGSTYSEERQLAEILQSWETIGSLEVEEHIISTSKSRPFEHFISRNISKSEIFNNFSPEYKYFNTWPHANLLLSHFEENVDSKWAILKAPILTCHQPVDGWYSQDVSLDALFKLNEIYFDAFTKNPHLPFLEFQQLRKNTLNFVGTVIHFRITSGNHRARMKMADIKIIQNSGFIKSLYIFLAIKCPILFLRHLRFVNSKFLSITLHLGFRKGKNR